MKPNIVLILADDLGYGDLSCYGNTELTTPHLDRLAATGVRLSQHYSGSPICSPARACLLTGRYNHRTGALSVESNRGLDRIALRERTIAEILHRAGYATGMVGKWHNGLFDLRHHPNTRGFEEFVGFLNGGMDYWDWLLDYNGRSGGSDGRYLTDVFAEEAVQFIERHARRPFFLYLAFNAPHSPLQAPADDVRPYSRRGRFNLGVSTLYAMIRRMDEGIGRVLDTLEKLGLQENTIVLFTSDNGPWLGNDRVGPDRESVSMLRYNGPFRGMKQDVLEGGIRVPAILRWPAGLDGGREHHGMVHFSDWLPTLLAAAGIASDAGLPWDGVSQIDALRGSSGAVSPVRFWQFNRYEPVPHCNAAVRAGDWKLYWPWIPEAARKLEIDNEWYRMMFTRPHFETEVDRTPLDRPVGQPRPVELYNLAHDPHESTNLAPAHPERVARMTYALDNWFETVNAERRRIAEVWKT